MAGYPGQQGRKPKAANIIEGQKGRNINDKKPVCPAWLPLEAKRIWRRESLPLYEAGLLTFVDGPAFANYCLIRAQLKKAQEELGTDKLTYEVTNKYGEVTEKAKPQIAIIQKCVEQLKSLSSEFGMTPASRTRIPAIDNPDRKAGNALRERILTGDPRKVLEG